jgi:hypothetical protein
MVIEAIAKAENIDPRQTTFFDLRTNLAYSDLQAGGTR